MMRKVMKKGRGKAREKLGVVGAAPSRGHGGRLITADGTVLVSNTDKRH